jgi:succinoglycan biosynthesis transport protein ExoP
MMSATRSQWMNKRFELMREQALLKAMEEDPHGKNLQLPEAVLTSMVSAQPEVERLEGQLSAKQQLLVETEKSLSKKDHPALVDIRKQIGVLSRSLAETRERVRPRVEQKIREDFLAKSETTLQGRRFRVDLATQEEERLREEFELLQKEAKKLGSTSFELEDKKDQIASLEKIAGALSNEINAVKVELSAPPRVTLLQEAEPPTQRDTKKRLMATLGGGVGGFAMVCFLIALAEARLRRVMSIQDVAPTLRVMGHVPLIPAWITKSNRAAKSKKGRFWHDMLTESVDAARTLLVHDAEQEDLRVIMVSSAMPAEGKTTLSCHIAGSLARAGRKVVLVDCDFRRPNVHRVFGVENKAGFCEVLLGKTELDAAIQPGVTGGPALLTAGHLTPSVTPLLGMEEADQLFRSLRERFEFVIVDTSPLLIVHETLIVARHVDAAIVAVRKNISRQPNVKAMVARLQAVEVPVLGTVAIGLESDAHGYGASYYQGYANYYSAKRPR